MTHTHSYKIFLFSLTALTFFSLGGISATAAEAQKDQDSEPLKSGIPVAEPIDSFYVQDITGPSKGKSLCYACQYGAKPVIAVFFKEPTDQVAELLKEVDQTVQSFENKKLRAFAVLLTDDPEADKQKLVELAEKHDLKKVPLTTYDSVDGPPNYQIKQAANVNVMLWYKARVKANHAFRSSKELTEEQRQIILQDTDKILP